MAKPWEKYQVASNEPVRGPWENYAQPESSKPESTSDDGFNAEAALQGFGEGASFGYLPQLQALTEQGLQFMGLDPTQSIDEQLRAKGFQVPGPSSLTEKEAQFETRQGKLREAAPEEFLGGQIAGAVTGGVAAGGAGAAGIARAGIKPAATGLGRIAAGSLSGAGAGLLQAPEGERIISEGLDISGRLEQAKTGAKFGALASAAPEALKQIGKLSKSGSRMFALKSLGLKQSTLNKITAKGKKASNANEVADELLKRNLIQPGQTIEDAAEKIGQELDVVGEQIGEIYKSVDDSMARPEFWQNLSTEQLNRLNNSTISARTLAQKVLKDVSRQFKGTANKKAAAREMDEIFREMIADFGTDGPINLKDMQRFRRSIDDRIRDFVSPDKTVDKVRLIIRNKMQDLVQSRVDAFDAVSKSKRLPAPIRSEIQPLVNELKSANKSFSKLKDAETVVKNGLGLKGNRFLGLSESIGFGTGYASGEGDFTDRLAKGIALGAGARFLKTRGASFGPALLKGPSALANLPSISPAITGAVGGKLANEREGTKQ